MTAQGSIPFPSEIANFTVNCLDKDLRKQPSEKRSDRPRLETGNRNFVVSTSYDYFTVNVGHFRPSILRMSRRNPACSLSCPHDPHPWIHDIGYALPMQRDVVLGETPDASRRSAPTMQLRAYSSPNLRCGLQTLTSSAIHEHAHRPEPSQP